jgi:hypothetical protein
MGNPQPDHLSMPPRGGPTFVPTYLANPYNVRLDTNPDGTTNMAAAAYVRNSWNVIPPSIQEPIYEALDKAYGKGNYTSAQVSALWKASTDDSANAVAMYSGRQDINKIPSPLDMALQRIPQLAQNGLLPDGKLAKGAGGAGGISTSFQKSIRLTDPGSARKLVDTALGQYLGRAATSEEQRTFMKALNAQEKAAPMMTQSTTSMSGRSSSTSSVTTGGFDPNVFAEEYAQGQEGAGEFQAATSLLDTFIKSIGAKV